MKQPLLCVDCHFYEPYVDPEWTGTCAHRLCKKEEKVHLVTGAVLMGGSLFAAEARETYGPCGKSGRLFKPKSNA